MVLCSPRLDLCILIFSTSFLSTCYHLLVFFMRFCFSLSPFSLSIITVVLFSLRVFIVFVFLFLFLSRFIFLYFSQSLFLSVLLIFFLHCPISDFLVFTSFSSSLSVLFRPFSCPSLSIDFVCFTYFLHFSSSFAFTLFFTVLLSLFHFS